MIAIDTNPVVRDLTGDHPDAQLCPADRERTVCGSVEMFMARYGVG
jgi:hypothetical protein